MTDKLKTQAILREFIDRMVQKHGPAAKEILNKEIFKLNQQKRSIEAKVSPIG